MSDPNAVVDAVADPAPAPAPQSLSLVEPYPACFDWERPRPLKVGIHKDLRAAGFGGDGVKPAEIKRALARYCKADRYRRALRVGAARIDLHGRPAGAVTEREAAHARNLVEARAAARESLPPDAAPVPKEQLAPGRLELAAKFSEPPASQPVPGGVKIGVRTEAGTVTALLPAKVWRKLEQSARTCPQWVAALSGSLARFAEGEIVLQHPTVQVFERKARPEAPDRSAPAPTRTEPTPEGHGPAKRG